MRKLSSGVEHIWYLPVHLWDEAKICVQAPTFYSLVRKKKKIGKSVDSLLVDDLSFTNDAVIFATFMVLKLEVMKKMKYLV